MILYHFTKPEYLQSVLTQGLIPSDKTRRRGMAHGLSWTCVFLTDSPDYIVEHQCGKNWRRVLLEVDCTGLDIKKHRWYHSDETYAPHEFCFEGVIPPNRIKCVSTF
jgi:hypothetical protein